MKKILIVSGSRADYGLLQPVADALIESGNFKVRFEQKEIGSWDGYEIENDDLLIILGDRHEILQRALYAHLRRIPIAHIAGGDITLGSYDDAMRDCISRLATYHFVTSHNAMARLCALGYRNVHMVGNPALDVIMHSDWVRLRPYAEPYIVINYQPETLAADPAATLRAALPWLPIDKKRIYFLPNPDRGSDAVTKIIRDMALPSDEVIEFMPHHEYLNLINHCDELIGNSSSLIYEAPALGVKTRMLGDRQKGRALPEGNGTCCQKIAQILRYTL